MSRLFATLLVLFALALSVPAGAVVVSDLYAASVPVSDQGSAALDAGARQALAEVIVKVSGSRRALENPAVAAAIANARALVQQYAFHRDPGHEDALTARFEFSGSYVTGLLSGAGLPVWTANRPRVLVWMAVETGGARRFVNPAENPELAAQLMDAFQRRGVPAQLPLYDLVDATAVDIDEVWEQRVAAVQAASARYGVEDILVGRAVEISSGDWVGDWSYLHGLDRRERSDDSPTVLGFIDAGVALVTEDMASRYAVAPSAAGEGRVRLGVSGVRDFGDYAAIVHWLEGLELVDHADVESLDGDRLELVLVSSMDAPRLRKILELNRHLQPLDPAGGSLEYQWRN